MQATISTATHELLIWLASRPRTYAEAMEAWRTSCPRLSAWEDALDDRLIEIESGARLPECRVVLTARGHEAVGL